MCDLAEASIPLTEETLAAKRQAVIDASFGMPYRSYPGSCYARQAYRYAFAITAFHLAKARLIETSVIFH